MPAPEHTYSCVLIEGTGTATQYIAPLLDAWAASRRITLAPGTLNLCAETPVRLPSAHVSLTPWRALMSFAARREQPGFAPRLYPVIVGGHYDAWLYRWCEERDLLAFVGDTELCRPEQMCEIVSPVHFCTTLGLTIGGRVDLTIPGAP